jgi:hypothetical protein
MSFPQWSFPDNGGGEAAGFNDSSIDHFKGRRLSSLVREVIQNSIDARVETTKPVVVDFSWCVLATDQVPEVSGLGEHIEMSRETARLQKLDEAVSFYGAASETIESDSIKFLAIHDTNTTGLEGDLNGPGGAWYALTKGSGLTQKRGTSLGSFGHGSKAPFASSKLRSVFYLSHLSGADGSETRFQGKSILQSYRTKTGGMTQGTGFFGNPERCSPLVDASVPAWAIQMRSDRTVQRGTSIIIPGCIWEEKSTSSVCATAIANFFYAIWKGDLEVIVGTTIKLTAANVVDEFKKYNNWINGVNSQLEEVDKEAIEEAFKSIETVVNPTERGEQQVANFGRIDWYIRMADNVEGRSVAVARGNGMLITKRAPWLSRFQNLKPFDFFVCVTGEGSALLKSIENPEHTNFEFERVDDRSKKQHVEKRYRLFVNAVKEILERWAAYSTADQVVAEDLRDLFGGLSRNEESSQNGEERGRSIQIVCGNANIRKTPVSSSAKQVGDRQLLPGSGQVGGGKKSKNPGGLLPTPDGIPKILGPSRPDEPGVALPKVHKLQNFRIRPSPSSDGEVTIFFDSQITGRVSVRLMKAGELSNEKIHFLSDDGLPVIGLDVDLQKGVRTRLKVRLAEPLIDFAMEGEAHESEC